MFLFVFSDTLGSILNALCERVAATSVFQPVGNTVSDSLNIKKMTAVTVTAT